MHTPGHRRELAPLPQELAALATNGAPAKRSRKK
jgi:hypothetical protein